MKEGSPSKFNLRSEPKVRSLEVEVVQSRLFVASEMWI